MINYNQINIITFGRKEYNNSLERIKNEALSFNIFDKILIYNDINLKNDFPEFWEKHENFIINNKRGYGYWIWKSYLTLKTLENMNDNDILVYADAGCTLNKNGIQRLNEYFNMVRNNDCANVSFQMPQNIEKKWTKMDIFNFLDIKDTSEHFSSGQLIAGIFIVRKCDFTMNLVNEWYNIMSNNYNLIDDSPSILPNDHTFSENRHDQSIFSLLRKKYGTIILSDETDRYAWKYETYINYPIWRKI
jgi:hypothetical protein